jgi:hypothetical protein
LLENHTEKEFDEHFNISNEEDIAAKDIDKDLSEDEDKVDDIIYQRAEFEKKIEENEGLWHVQVEVPISKILKGLSSFNTMSDILSSFKDFREFDQFCIF